MSTTRVQKETRSTKPKTTSTISWVSDKLAAGAARVNGGEFQDVDVAVVKATNHDVVSPKEKHVRTLREIVASTPNSKKVIYIVHALYERLVAPNETWLVVLKTLMVFHKLLKADGEATFKSQITRYKEKRKLTELLRLNNFSDKSQKEAWDFSAFVRVYSSYLDERVHVFEAIKFDVDRDGGGTNVRFKTATGQELLNELPKVQKLLQRVLACVPEGAAAESDVVMECMRTLLTECFRLYRVISEGVINLAEQFFEMDRVDASKGLDMYRESINSGAQMQSFFSAIQNLSVGRQIQFPQLTPPPEDFLEQMEEYVKGATGRTTTRKFASTISRNAKGTPAAALAPNADSETAVPQTKLTIISPEKKPEGKSGEPDLLGLDALTLNEPTPAPVDPFGDAVFQSAPAKEGGFLDDWGHSGAMSSPVSGSAAAEQNASPFDDFFGGGPMAQPPPAPDSTSPSSFVQQPSFAPQPFVQPQAPTFHQPVPQAVSNNPFGGGGGFTPMQSPAPQQPVQRPPQALQRLPSQNQAAIPFAGPGALADPFAGLTPTIQKKTSFALPGEPMRQDSMGAGNPFGTGPPQFQTTTTTGIQSQTKSNPQHNFSGLF